MRQKINRSSNSLGIALAGHRNRTEMGCFIAGVNPKGAVTLDQFHVGDELLEVCRMINQTSERRIKPSLFFFDS